MSNVIVENIINVDVRLSQDRTSATVVWTSGQAGPFGFLFYAQGLPNDPTLVFSQITVGPTAFAQNTFTVVVTGLNPVLPYSFYVQTVGVNGTPLFDNEGDPIVDNEGEQVYSGNAQIVIAEMMTVDYLLNPLALPGTMPLSGVVPVSGGYPMQGPIQLGKDYAVDLVQGTVPDVSEALDEWYQYMTFEKVGKMTSGGTAFQVIETTVQIPFRGIITPSRAWELNLKPVAQRTWKFYKLYAERQLPLYTDDVVLWQGVQLRVMSVTDWSLYGTMEYELAQDWENRGPIS